MPPSGWGESDLSEVHFRRGSRRGRIGRQSPTAPASESCAIQLPSVPRCPSPRGIDHCTAKAASGGEGWQTVLEREPGAGVKWGMPSLRGPIRVKSDPL